MSERRRSRRRQLDASHQRNWLTGRHAVTEMISAGVWPIQRLCATAEAWEQLSPITRESAERPGETPPVETVTADRLTELCGSRHHQGIAAQMGPFPYQALTDLKRLISQLAGQSSLPPLVVLCDRIQDAHNLGAILRSCDAMAVTALVIGEREQVGVTPQVARSSAGAVNCLPVVRVNELGDAADQLQKSGFQLLAASEKSDTPVWDIDTSRPTALIIGSEARGVSESLQARCDQQVAIPMHGRVGSLNAAVAAGMLLYELRRGATS